MVSARQESSFGKSGDAIVRKYFTDVGFVHPDIEGKIRRLGALQDSLNRATKENDYGDLSAATESLSFAVIAESEGYGGGAELNGRLADAAMRLVGLLLKRLESGGDYESNLEILDWKARTYGLVADGMVELDEGEEWEQIIKRMRVRADKAGEAYHLLAKAN